APFGVKEYPIDDAEAATGTFLPLSFICTELFPSVSSSFWRFSVGIVWPASKIWPGISLLPLPSTRHTYTWPVGTSLSVTSVGFGGALCCCLCCLGLWCLVLVPATLGLVAVFLPLWDPTRYRATTIPTSTTPMISHGGTGGPRLSRSRS